MKSRKVLGWILKAPLILLVITSFGAGIYAAIENIEGITWATPIILGALIVLYLMGAAFHRKESGPEKKDINKEINEIGKKLGLK